MKKHLFSSILLVLLCSTLGCQNNIRTETSKSTKSVIPESVAGIWQGEGQPWQIVIEPDGTISSAVVAMGRNRLQPNKTTRIEMIDGKFSTYEAGDFNAEYNPSTQKLFVTITMNHIDVKIGNDNVEGDSEDVFIGTVSKNGLVWETKWTTFYDYGERFPMPEEVYSEPLTFHKVLVTNEDKPKK